jgi:hypothetical protein
MSYLPDDYENSTCKKCPNCGRFVSLEDGFYDREDREDECARMLAFCDEQCADKWHPRRAKRNADIRAWESECQTANPADYIPRAREKARGR